MAFARPLLLCSALALAGCGGGLANSWVNPVNWFGNSRSEAVDPRAATNPLIPARKGNMFRRGKAEYAGVPVDQITALRIERRPGGAIVHTVGVTDVIGYHNVRLEPDNENGPVDGVLAYTLKAERPSSTVGVGGEAARQINAAVFLTDQELNEIKTITVRGARNQRSTRRR